MGNHTSVRMRGRLGRALARITPGGNTPGENTARAWEREIRRRAGSDARYQPAGIKEAASHPIDTAAITRVAGHEGVDPHTIALKARMNVASIASVPRTQISARTRAYFMASAARGEDTYAYPPISREGPLNTPWNIWYRGQRAEINVLEEATGGVVESTNPGRLTSGNPQLPGGR